SSSSISATWRFFSFSGRGRHTRSKRDWSSDVCSSDLTLTVTPNNQSIVSGTVLPSFSATITGFVNGDAQSVVSGQPALTTTATRSEERRVGKEGRAARPPIAQQSKTAQRVEE